MDPFSAINSDLDHIMNRIGAQQNNNTHNQLLSSSRRGTTREKKVHFGFQKTKKNHSIPQRSYKTPCQRPYSHKREQCNIEEEQNPTEKGIQTERTFSENVDFFERKSPKKSMQIGAFSNQNDYSKRIYDHSRMETDTFYMYTKFGYSDLQRQPNHQVFSRAVKPIDFNYDQQSYKSSMKQLFQSTNKRGI